MEHRHLERKSLFLYLDVLNRETNALLGHLGDISEGGMMLITERSLSNSQLLKIRIKLPEDEGLPPHLDLDVDIRWIKPDANPALHCVGCHFEKTSDDDITTIRKIEALLEF